MCTFLLCKRSLISSESVCGITTEPAERKGTTNRSPRTYIRRFPEQYGGEKCGINVTEEQLSEVAELSHVLKDTDDFLKPAVRRECQQHLPDITDIEPNPLFKIACQ